jgi:hypothetical protein
MVMVGDRGMITNARISQLRELGGFGWVTALRAPDIAALAADDGPLQMSLFDQANLAEISHPDFPGERLLACRNPAPATERTRKRLALLDATDLELTKIAAAVGAGRLVGAGKIGIRVGKVIGRYKMAKHYTLSITDSASRPPRRDRPAPAPVASNHHQPRTKIQVSHGPSRSRSRNFGLVDERRGGALAFHGPSPCSCTDTAGPAPGELVPGPRPKLRLSG